MTRMDSVRAAGTSAKESVRHAAEVVAPYAETARDAATQYAHEARVRVAPKVASAAHQARAQYDVHLAPRVHQAREALPPQVDQAATKAVMNTRRAARQAVDYTAPRIESAVEATRPVAVEAAARSTAALYALKGQVTPDEIRRMVRQHERRHKAARILKGVAVVGVVAGVAFAVWKWWDQQSNPDWLVEPPAATEVPDRGGLGSLDGSASSNGAYDPEVEAKQAEADRERGDL
ncbi:DUF5324 family protein [Streptomyces sp. NPDC101132]|uniref:DUF5324 family protein n=1 Tax=Streptomyces sp. NPDC101132 TaxID=3366110 RepID=UPI0038262296